MFGSFSIFHFLVYTTCFGFVAAIIYTNVQRTALSKFITFLIENNKFDESTAVQLSDINLSSLEKSVIKSAVKNQNGMKRCVNVVKADNSGKDKLELALEGSDNDKYYITNSNTEELLKKYSYKTLSTKFVVLFIAVLCIVVILATAAVDWLIKEVTIPEIQDNNGAEIEEPNTSIDDVPDIGIDDNNENTDVDTEHDNTKPENPYIVDTQNENTSGGPRIPVLK